jgi:predicted 3-demethylubiquinone-9 3-methyltransferase (glyoxalase superfamily)
MTTKKKITHCLWFDRNAEEAVRFYLTVFKDGKINAISRYTEAGFEHHGMPKGTVMVIDFDIAGENYQAINGGPIFKLNEAFSIVVNCDDQKEIDYYWSKLTEGGEEVQCGWLKDRFGLSWQVVPRVLGEMMADKDPEKVRRVSEAFFGMKKFDIAALERAYAGKAA